MSLYDEVSPSGGSLSGAALSEDALSAESAAGDLAVRLRGVRKRFGYRDVLRGIDLDVPSGSCFVLTGPNGAGKSTVLRVIATQWTFSSGSVEVLGLDVPRASLHVKSLLGAVFHESFLRPELSLEENLKFSASLHGLRWNDVAESATSLLDRLGLSRRRQDALSTFSEGMTRRADLIRSLLHRPELWILDEPFAGLDAGGCELLETMIREYVQTGRTVLLVTHRTALGERLAGGGAALEDGRVVVPRAASPASNATAPLIRRGR